jgi:midasin (ATPase involved in ribosome maturation)
MTSPTYALPLNDSDRATLRLHAASIGKSPAQSDEALVAIYYGNPPKAEPSGTPSTVTAEQVAEQLRKPVTERLVQAAKDKVQTITDAAVDAAVKAAVDAVQVHRTVRIEVKRGDDIKVLSDEYRHPIFMDVLTALSVRENVYLVGGAGSGKTTLAKQAADALGLPFYSTGAVGMAYQLQGFINAEGDYMATDLYRAYTEGGVFLFDEIDGSSANAILAFNAIAANDFAAFPNGTVKRHDDFVIIAAANTYGNGANRDYIGRAPLDGSSLDRFGFIAMDYDEKLELAISLNDIWTRWVQQCRKVANEHRMQVIISPRASIKGGKMLSAGMSVDKVADMYIFKGMTQADRARFPSLPAL